MQASGRARLHVLPADAWVEVPRGETLLQAVEDAGFQIETLCGGRGICKRCQVVAAGLDKPPKRLEREAFSADELQAGYRLACLWKVQDDLEVEIVPLEDYADKAFSGIASWPAIEVAPNVRRWNLHLRPPTLEDQRSDSRRLRDALGDEGPLRLDYEVATGLAEVLRAARFSVSVTAIGDRVVAVEHSHLRPPVGVAVDIGTTSVAAMLVNLKTGTAAEIGAHSNSQGRHGAEVMTRIEFARTPEGARDLQEAVVGDLNRIIDECCEAAAVRHEDIFSVAVAGNTTMVHLFLGLTPEHIGAAPFTGVVDESVTVPAARLGLHAHPRAECYVLPSVAGFVGADTVGAVLATRLDQGQATRVLMDIGTNGEIALSYKGELYTASAPAGPAFEGGQIRHGMRAATGAIEAVQVVEPGELEVSVIGGVAPRGICGSALVDLCAELVRVGVVEASGRLLTSEEVRARGGTSQAERLAGRVQVSGRRREIVVVEAAASATGAPIVLTQGDIRQYQLVKSAIATGASILLGDLGLDASDLEGVFLAGSFGSHIDLASARRTGLVPDVEEDRLHYVGNAALEGARMALLNPRYRREAEALAARSHHVELSARADMSEQFLAGLGLGPSSAATPGAPGRRKDGTP